jgi:hypothetical protein
MFSVSRTQGTTVEPAKEVWRKLWIRVDRRGSESPYSTILACLLSLLANASVERVIEPIGENECGQCEGSAWREESWGVGRSVRWNSLQDRHQRTLIPVVGVLPDLDEQTVCHNTMHCCVWATKRALLLRKKCFELNPDLNNNESTNFNSNNLSQLKLYIYCAELFTFILYCKRSNFGIVLPCIYWVFYCL